MKIRRLRKGDEDRLREVRLRALAEAPYAFASTLEHERRFAADVWTSRVTSDRSVNFLAEDDDGPVGTVAAIQDNPDTAQLVGMWVAPEARGNGLARLLIDAVVTWPRERGVRHLELWVAEGNEPARALYEKCGFSFTGDRQPFPSDPALIEARLVREL